MTSLLLLTAVSLWGVSFVVTKICLNYISPAEIIAARFIFALPVLYFIVWKQGLSFKSLPGQWKIILGSAAILVVHLVIQVEGMKTTTATNTAWLIATIPVFIVAFSFIFLKERIRLLQGLGMALAAFGVLILVSRGNLTSLDFIKSYGDWLVLGSCVTWTIYTILGKKMTGSPLAVLTVVLSVAAAIIVPPVLFDSGIDVYFYLPSHVILALLFLGILCMGLAFWLWNEALKRKPAGKVGAYLYFEPFSTMLVAPFVLGESITPSLLAGGVLVIFGVWLVEGGWAAVHKN